MPEPWQKQQSVHYHRIRPIALRLAMIPFICLSIGWTRQERGVLDRAKKWKDVLNPDAFITVHCKGSGTTCTYPDASGKPQWGCVINLDTNEDGRIDVNQAVYGAAAEAELLKCRNPG